MENAMTDFLKTNRMNKAQCQKVHETSCELLERVGVRLDLEEARNILRKAGAKKKNDGMMLIPSGLVERAMKTAPKQVVLYDRNGNPVMPVKDRLCYYGPGSDCLNIIDHRDGIRRKAVLQDTVDGTILCGGLEEVDFVMSMVLPSDIDTAIADRYQMETMLSHTVKPIIYVSYEYEGCVDCVAMAEAVVGNAKALRDKPNVACYINVISGLHHNKDALQKLLFLSSRGLPALYIPSSTGGVTSPITMAGSLAMDYAGVLVGLVLSQLVREGAPIIVPGMAPGQLDMRTMISTYSEPERGHSQSLAHYYGLPMFSLGGASESKLVDQQAAAEAALTLMSETLAGGNIIHDLGYLESGLTFSFAQLLICSEIVSWIKGYTKAIPVDDEALALEVISDKGPEGQYLDSEHTRKHFRKRWYPDLFERKTYDMWAIEGGKTLLERASEKVAFILSNHKTEPLPQRVSKRLRAIVEKASIS
jgi:trimethylamine--corrinoid protein Co-methyltransferase